MSLFPTIASLAAAPIERVIKAWEGLGYYSRARNLHVGARYVLEAYGGELPSTYNELIKVKGLGPYTVGAILSFAFKQRSAAVDGNVLRVLARYYGIEDPIDKRKTQREIQTRCFSILPKKEGWVIMEAIIELGALVCQKKASCHSCPLAEHCQANLLGKATQLPVKSKSEKTIHLYRHVGVIYSGEKLLIKMGEKGKVMEGLAEFPYCDREQDLEKELGISLTSKKPLSQETHGFTKYKAFLFPHLYEAQKIEITGHHWVPFKSVSALPFSSGHRRILAMLRKNNILPI